MKKGSIHQEDLRILNIYVSNKRDSQYKQQYLIELKEELGMSINIVRDFNTLSIIDRTSREKISKDTEDLNNTIKQLDLIDIYGTVIQLDQVNHSF